MQIRAEPEKSALPICNYSQILYQFLTFTQNLKRSPFFCERKSKIVILRMKLSLKLNFIYNNCLRLGFIGINAV